MSTPKGYSSQEKDDRLSAQFATVEPIRELQNGLSVLAHQFVYEVTTGTVDGGTTKSIIITNDCTPIKGDVISFTSGPLVGQDVKVWAVDAPDVVLSETLTQVPGFGDTFRVLRHKYPLANSDGSLAITLTEQAIESEGSAPATAEVKMAGGFDGTNAQYLKTDAAGELQVDVLSSALPTGASTEATLATLATEATVATLATEATVATLATESTLATLATEATLSNLDAKVTVVDTSNVTVVSSALPTGAATQTTLATLATEATVSTLGTETTLLAVKTAVEAIENTVSGSELQVDVVTSALPTGAATSAKQPALGIAGTASADVITVQGVASMTALKVDVNTLSVVDLLDAGILDTSSTNINGSASAPTQVVASTAAATKKLQLLDTTGAFIGVYTGAALSEVLQFVMGPGSDQTIEHAIPAATRISLKRLDSTTAISSGIVAINFIG